MMKNVQCGPFARSPDVTVSRQGHAT